MNKRKIGAFLFACALMGYGMSSAEEMHLGDYIYVPAMQEYQHAGTIKLRVEGKYCAEDGTMQTVSALPGAEFGIYVIAGDGQVMPWANPLYPSAPMRVRTAEEEIGFTLPQGTEFYLRQESAPQGYLFDGETLLPVCGEEIVVTNMAAGEITVSVRDSQGNPVSGAMLTARDEKDTIQTLKTGENGEATFFSDGSQKLTIEEALMPDGVFALQHVYLDGVRQENMEVSVAAAPATRTRIVFEHQASGTVALNVKWVDINAYGEAEEKPLANVVLEVLGDHPVVLTTDEQGQAVGSFVEGTYDIRVSYAGNEDAKLPIEQGQMIVRSGETTAIDLVAKGSKGRVAATGTCAGQAVGAGSILLKNTQTEEEFGPYTFNAQGVAVSGALPDGLYTLEVKTPEGMTLGGFSDAQQTVSAAQMPIFSVQAGELTNVQVQMLRRENQRLELIARSVDEEGKTVENSILSESQLELIDENGQTIALFSAAQGFTQIEALSGMYCLQMDEKTANALGVSARSEVFALPNDEGIVRFDSRMTRLVLASVDENDLPISGVVYKVTDSTGTAKETVSDANGEAVTDLIAVGDVHIETKSVPQNYNAGDERTVYAGSGEALRIPILHENYGRAHLNVTMRSLDEQGNALLTPLSGVQLRLFAVEDNGQRMTELGLALTSDDDGVVDVQLAPGEYVAQIQESTIEVGSRTAQALRFAVHNTQVTNGALVCFDALGGLRVKLIGGELSDEESAQVRFALLAQNGDMVAELTAQEGAFYVGKLAAGNYVLSQKQMPQGYTLSKERTVSIVGGEVLQVEMPLEEYAVLSVSKTGLTFNDALQTYVVPLEGQYGIYTMEDGKLMPYPSASAQRVVWSNVQEGADGKSNSVKLPAVADGTVYYIREIGGANGFAQDTQVYEVSLCAGETRVLNCAVSSDRGFFRLDQRDAETGAHVSGGVFELLDQNQTSVLDFELGDTAFQNAMALPVGSYTLRQKQAAPGYVLNNAKKYAVNIQPYLTQGGNVTYAELSALPLPTSEEIPNLIEELHCTQEQGLTLVCVSGGKTRSGEQLVKPQLALSVCQENGNRADVLGVQLADVRDENGHLYFARVEYCLANGGWQMSDARMTDVLNAPTWVDLQDVTDDICGVRVSYLNAETGEETAGGGFTPGQVCMNIRVSAEGEANVQTEAVFSGDFVYQTSLSEAEQTMMRKAEKQVAFTVFGNGLFETVSAGRDGKISGTAFFDADADGVWDVKEETRYAGLTVSLVTADGERIGTVRTDANGYYEFDSLSSGVYAVAFDAGDHVVFSSCDRYSAHVTSSVEDTRYGLSMPVIIDGEHTDRIVNAGCIYAASLIGAAVETENGVQSGLSGLNVELHHMFGGAEEEPIVVTTDDAGTFTFGGLLPGVYEMVLYVPDGYLCADAQDGRITEQVTLSQGDAVFAGGEAYVLSRACSVFGSVLIDDDGDGVIGENAQALSDVQVVLLAVQDGHTDALQTTHTDANGLYRFDDLYAGAYSVLFELNGEWTFTHYGRDSAVYGAVSQSGTTKTFELLPGEDNGNLNVGVTLPAQLTVTAYKDTQPDGVMGPYEQVLDGVSISLIRLENGEDAEEMTYKTGADGAVVFAGVSPGEYVIGYRMPGQWRATRNAQDPNNPTASCVPQSFSQSGRSEPFTLSMGQNGVRMYIGAILSGSISGVVYYDDNADAQKDAQEETLSNVTVELLSAQEEVLETVASGADGSYAFEGLAPGRYRVRFTAQDDCGFSGNERTMGRGGVQPSENHVSATRWITVSGGSTVDTADAGVVRLCAVGGMLWQDVNGNRVVDAGEQELSDVSVQLMNASARSILATSVTDANGRFQFEHLMPGTYTIRVDAPSEYVFSGAAEGSVLPIEFLRDGRAYSAAFTLLGGADVSNIAYGLLTQSTISGKVWFDQDYDGLMGESEEGLRGVTLSLLNEQGETVATKQTPRTGEFSFDKLMPGSYSLSATLEDGYVYTVGGKDSALTRQNETNAVLYLGTVEMGHSIENVKIGALMPMSIGGNVWLDRDDDGRRQVTDEGVAETKVTLTVQDGTDIGQVVETVADANGAYRFDGVMPGEIQLAFELPQGYAFAKNAVGTKRVSSVPRADARIGRAEQMTVASGEDRLDLDVGAVGVGQISGAVWLDSGYDGLRKDDEIGVESAVVALMDASSGEIIKAVESDANGCFELDFVRMGEYKLFVTLPEGMLFTTDGESKIAHVDEHSAATERFELNMGESIEGIYIGAIRPASISGVLHMDGTDAGMPDVMVTLMQGGTVVAATHTQADGSYVLPKLRPGAYRLRITLPANALFAKETMLNLAYEDAQEGETGEYVLSMGQRVVLDEIRTVYASSVSGRSWRDDDMDGRIGSEEMPLPGVWVALLNADANNAVIAETEIGENGLYSFGLLRSGNYALRFTLPNGNLFADQSGEADGSCVAPIEGAMATTDAFALAMGENRKEMNIGAIRPGAIGDTVWLDLNQNGLQDYREPLLSGVSVTLLRVNNDGSLQEANTMESDAYGYYRFADLRPGIYRLRLNAREGDVPTMRFGAGLAEIDSDIDPQTGMSDELMLASGQMMLNVDIGLVQSAD